MEKGGKGAIAPCGDPGDNMTRNLFDFNPHVIYLGREINGVPP